MKRNFILLGLIAFLMQCSALQLKGQNSGQNTATWVAADLNGAAVTDPFNIDNYVKCQFAKGAGQSAPAFYTNHVRLYANNTVTINQLNGASISKVEFTCKKNNRTYLSASVTAPSYGTWTDPVPATTSDTVVATWEGALKESLILTMGTSGQRVLIKIVVTYSSPDNTIYHVTYRPNGGVGDDIVVSEIYNATMTVMENPFDRDEFVFDKWNTQADGQGVDYIPGNTFSLVSDIDLYAQWTTSPDLFVDVFNPTNVNDAMGDVMGYNAWTLNFPNSESPRITYQGKSARSNNYIQLTSSISGASAYSGIVTSYTHNLKAQKVKVTWNGASSDGCTLEVYGKDTPYSGTSDLYNDDSHGTYLGSIVKGTSTELDITAVNGIYSYIGLRSNSGAVYLSEIRIIWETLDSALPVVRFEPYSVELGNVVVNIPLNANFTVSQANLTEAVALHSEPALGTFSVNGETVTEIAAGAAPTVVTWNYTPTTAGPLNVSVIATSGSAANRLSINGTVLEASAQTLHESKAAFAADNTNSSACINLADVEVIAQSGNYLYLQDAEAGLLVYGNGAPVLQIPCKFTSGYLEGTYTNYHGIIELQNFQFVNAETTQNMQLTTTVATVDQILGDPVAYESRYVVISNTTISNWALPGASANLPFYDVFHTNYAFCTTPGTIEIFTVKGMVNRHWSNPDIYVELAPTALSDISTTAQAVAPTITLGGTEATPVSTTYVDITPGANSTAVYSMWRQNGNDMELVVDSQRITSAININIIGKTEIKVHGERDFYANTEEVDYWYDLPANTRSVQFSINGVIDPQNTVLVTSTLSPAQIPAVTVYGDFGLLGWSTDPSSTSVIDLGTYQFTQNTTLYAVYYRGTSFQYVKVDNVANITEGDYVITVSSGSTPYTLENGRTSATPAAHSIAEYGLMMSGNQLMEAEGQTANYGAVSWSFTGTLDEMTIKSVAYPDSWLYTANQNTGVRVSNNVSGVVEWSIEEDNLIPGLFNLKCKRNDRYLALYNNQDWRSYQTLTAPNSYPRIALYRKTAAEPGENDPKYTRVFWSEVASDDIEISGPSIIPSGYYLDMNNYNMTNGAAANFLIEDGATFKVTYGNTGIKATVKKDIAGYVNDTVLTGWHLLSSPVGLISIDHQHAPGGLLVGNYDLYAFDQSKSLQWQNYEADATVVFGEQGGLLYANKDNTTIVFTGSLTASVQPEDLAYVANRPLSGWNLIGNPYMTNGYLNFEYTGQDEGTAITDYYYMKDVSENGKKFSKLIATSITNPVYPMEGVFVQAPSAGYRYWFVNSNRGQNVVQSEYVNIKLSGDDDEVVDVARVRFNEGSLMGKFDFGEGGSQLYIPQGGKKYAVVPTQRQGELPLSFKAAKNGTYTLTFDLEEASMDYLHLIDNKTGADVDLLALRQAQGPATYTFNASVDDYTARFRLLFEANCVLGNDNFAYYDGSVWVVTGHYDNATLQVVDMLGRVLSSQTINGSTELNVNQAQGVYVLRLINGNEIKSQKIVVR